MRTLLAAALLSALLLVPAHGVRADETPDTTVETPAAPEPANAASPDQAPTRHLGRSAGPATPSDGRAAIDDWNDRRGWRYGTGMLFPLTRGMDEAGIPRGAQWPLYLVTVPLDVALLPLGAVGGLFGG